VARAPPWTPLGWLPWTPMGWLAPTQEHHSCFGPKSAVLCALLTLPQLSSYFHQTLQRHCRNVLPISQVGTPLYRWVHPMISQVEMSFPFRIWKCPSILQVCMAQPSNDSVAELRRDVVRNPRNHHFKTPFSLGIWLLSRRDVRLKVSAIFRACVSVCNTTTSTCLMAYNQVDPGEPVPLTHTLSNYYTTSSINFLHFPWSIASSLPICPVWQSFSMTSVQVCFGLPYTLPLHAAYYSRHSCIHYCQYYKCFKNVCAYSTICSRWFNGQENTLKRQYKACTILLNAGVAWNMKLAIISFPWQFSGQFRILVNPLIAVKGTLRCRLSHIFFVLV